MTDTPQPRLQSGLDSEGKPAALIAWGLYVLSIPSANVLVLVGLVVAYAARGSATGVARQHMDAQIALFWSVFWWTIALWVLIALSAVTVILIPLAIVFWLLWFLLSVWFTVKSVLGIINLLQDRPA
ncbi:hypothetical protein [Brevundimonas aurifodinae]|uniref:Transmembrane protein n=2 Tax=Brevundimonas TaxID=41275 RepID=A0ABV1NSX0_9CAUL|nr:MAG: hypothetical protein B7Z01_07020 [Brevundimonas subvibrioides]